MGDRANVFIQTHLDHETQQWQGIGIYSHWHGTGLHTSALEHLPKAMVRVGDTAYFSRILIHNVLLDVADATKDTGTGIWTDRPCDNEHPILVINALSGHHWYAGDANYRSAAQHHGPHDSATD